MSLAKELQHQIAEYLVSALENDTVSHDRITFIARKIEMILPPSLSDDQVRKILPEISSIQELSRLEFLQTHQNG